MLLSPGVTIGQTINGYNYKTVDSFSIHNLTQVNNYLQQSNLTMRGSTLVIHSFEFYYAIILESYYD